MVRPPSPKYLHVVHEWPTTSLASSNLFQEKTTPPPPFAAGDTSIEESKYSKAACKNKTLNFSSKQQKQKKKEPQTRKDKLRAGNMIPICMTPGRPGPLLSLHCELHSGEHMHADEWVSCIACAVRGLKFRFWFVLVYGSGEGWLEESSFSFWVPLAVETPNAIDVGRQSEESIEFTTKQINDSSEWRTWTTFKMLENVLCLWNFCRPYFCMHRSYGWQLIGLD